MTRCHHFWVFIQRTQNSQRHTRPVVTAALLAGGRDTEAAEVSSAEEWTRTRTRTRQRTHTGERVGAQSQAEPGRSATWSPGQRRWCWVAGQPGAPLDFAVRNDGRDGGGPVHAASLDCINREGSWSGGSNAEETEDIERREARPRAGPQGRRRKPRVGRAPRARGATRSPKNPWGTLRPPRGLGAPSPRVHFPTSSPEHLVLCCRGRRPHLTLITSLKAELPRTVTLGGKASIRETGGEQFSPQHGSHSSWL